jgi:hypothetical protein
MFIDMNCFVDKNCTEPYFIRRNGVYKIMVGLVKLLLLKFALLPLLWSPTHLLSSDFNFQSVSQYYLYVLYNSINLRLGMVLLPCTW